MTDDELDTMDEATHRRVAFEVGALVREQFRLLRPMGEGPLGASWLASDANGGDVVLKVVGDMLVHNDRERGDLVGKLGMFAGRTLAGVVMPREVFAVPGSVVLVYPHVDAVSLRVVIDARRAQGQGFTPEECLRVAQALTAAVQAMHAASPHGALWPQNVLVTARGLLLVDGFLGVSVPPDRLAARVEHHVRAAPFAAPELFAGRRPTASADLYALGAIIAEIAGGAVPGEGPDLAAISPELHRGVTALLDREPTRRPGGIRAVLDALTAAAGLAHCPADTPLLVPEAVLAVPQPQSAAVEMPPAVDPATLQIPPQMAEVVVAPASARQAAPREAPPASEPDAPPRRDADGPPGRLRGPTATLPLANARASAGAIQSGPPASMAVKSGPPPGSQRPAPTPSGAMVPAPIAPAPAAPVAPAPVAPTAASGVPRPIAPLPGGAPRPAPRPIAPSAASLSIPSTPRASGEADARVAAKTLPSINDALQAAAAAAKRNAPPSRAPASAPTPPPSSRTPAPAPIPPSRAPSMPQASTPPAPSARPPVAPTPAPPPASRPTPPTNIPSRPLPPPRSLPPAPPARAVSASPPVVASQRPPPTPPQRPPAPPAPRGAPARGERSFDEGDEIDPRLLKAARMLDEERRRDQSVESHPGVSQRPRPT